MFVKFTAMNGGDLFVDPGQVSAVLETDANEVRVWLKGHRDPFTVRGAELIDALEVMGRLGLDYSTLGPPPSPEGGDS